jgi:hypothetical protein
MRGRLLRMIGRRYSDEAVLVLQGAFCFPLNDCLLESVTPRWSGVFSLQGHGIST